MKSIKICRKLQNKSVFIVKGFFFLRENSSEQLLKRDE